MEVRACAQTQRQQLTVAEHGAVSGDLQRQAVESLGGYAYQIYASAIAWATLSDAETLYLEVAEDYAVATGNALLGVQVKKTADTITLNSKAAIQAINSFVLL